MESNQNVPDFLEYAKPEGELKWDEEDSEPEDQGNENANNTTADDSWNNNATAALEATSGWDVGVEPAAAEKSEAGGWTW